MCRITMMSKRKNSPLNAYEARQIFTLAMLYSQTDDSQLDGAGFTDGVALVKTQNPFTHLAPSSIARLDPERAWIGHVRKKSPGTGSDLYAAHPYEFYTPGSDEKPAQLLVGVHNGYIVGTVTETGDVSNTDSYRALRNLNRVLVNSGLSAEVLERWLASFGLNSEWAFAWYWNGTPYFVRGQRPLYVSDVRRGNRSEGVILNTSADVLLQVSDGLRSTTPDLSLSRPQLLELHSWGYLADGEVHAAPYAFKAPTAAPAPKSVYIVDRLGDTKPKIL